MIFFSAGIGYMIMGSLYFFRNKFNFHKVALKIYKVMFYCGVVMILLGIGNLIFKNYIWMILYMINIATMVITTLRIFKNWDTAQTVADELTKK
ncbi:hypothetical protein D3C87_79970 [compost metagenome]